MTKEVPQSERVRRLVDAMQGDTVEVLKTTVLPSPTIGLAAPLDLMRAPLLALVEAAPHFAEPAWMPIEVERKQEIPIQVVRWESSPTVVVVEPHGEGVSLEPRSGTVVAWQGGALLVHLGAGPAVVRVLGVPDEIFIVGEPPGAAGSGAAVHVVRVARGSPALAPDAPIARILAGYGCDPWLRDAAEELVRGGTSFQRAAGVGLLARLWTPKGHAERERTVTSGDTVSTRAAAVAKRSPAAELDRIAAEARLHCAQLAGAVEAIAREAVEAPSGVAALARALVDSRDNLASVSWFLSHAGAEEAARELTTALEALDADAAAHHSVFAYAPDLGDDERVVAVFEIEPDAWWGSFVAS